MTSRSRSASRSDPRDVIATHVGRITASMIIDSLHDAGYIIVERGAIGRAQREAVRQYQEDNDNRPLPHAC